MMGLGDGPAYIAGWVECCHTDLSNFEMVPNVCLHFLGKLLLSVSFGVYPKHTSEAESKWFGVL